MVVGREAVSTYQFGRPTFRYTTQLYMFPCAITLLIGGGVERPCLVGCSLLSLLGGVFLLFCCLECAFFLFCFEVCSSPSFFFGGSVSSVLLCGVLPCLVGCCSPFFLIAGVFPLFCLVDCCPPSLVGGVPFVLVLVLYSLLPCWRGVMFNLYSMLRVFFSLRGASNRKTKKHNVTDI